MDRIRPLFTSSFLALWFAGCTDSDAPTPAVAPGVAADVASGPVQDVENPLRLEPWLADFPCEISYSPEQPGKWYTRSRRAALEKVAANLSGTCSRDAWLLAKEFFRRVENDENDILVQTLDRGIQSGSNDLVETTLAAMGAAGDTKFGPAILRAFQLRTRGVESAASRALETCADRETILASRSMFGGWQNIAQVKWFDAAIAVMKPEEVAADLRAVIALPQFLPIQKELINDALLLPAGAALHALEPILGRAADEVDVVIDALRHATGDLAGTARMQDWLRSDSPVTRARALGGLHYGGAEEFRDRILEMAADVSPNVRFEVLGLIRLFPFDDEIRATCETLALDENVRVRQAALFELRERGERAMLDDVLREIRTATGTRLRDLVGDLVAAQDPQVIPLLVERMNSAPVAERREYIKSIAFVKVRESFPPLRDVFLAEPIDYSDSEEPGKQLSSHVYMGVLMLNAKGAERDIVELFRSLPREDYARRVVLLETLTGLAVDRDDPGLSDAIFAAMRKVVFDGGEIPQMRLAALGHLKRGMTLDDVMGLKRQVRKETQVGMQRALNDFLLEYF
ncbi:MAG: hypothetical protein KDB80_17085 [Planctomycetes bacterium]|nr:hypothetical protein [Planctomycetota bacterium]